MVRRARTIAAALALLLTSAAHVPSADASSAAATPDGGAVIVQQFEDVPGWGDGPPPLFGLVHVGANGTVDQSFGRNGYVMHRVGPLPRPEWSVAVAPDGRIDLIGPSSSGTVLRRYHPDGSADETLGGDGEVDVTAIIAVDVAALPDGRLLLAGALPDGTTPALVRLRPDGSLDPSFGDGGVVSSTGSSDTWRSVRLYKNGDILARSDSELARFADDGSPIRTLAIGNGTPFGRVDAAAPADDGTVVAKSVGLNGIEVRRLQEDNSPDDAFGTGGTATLKLSAHDFSRDENGDISGSQVTYQVGDLRELPDGRLLVGTAELDDPDYGCGSTSAYASPVLLTSGGALDGLFRGSENRTSFEGDYTVRDAIDLPGGGLVVAARAFASRCLDPGSTSFGTVDAFDGAGQPLDGARLFPMMVPPTLNAVEGPADGSTTGPDVTFRFDATPANQLDEVGFSCKLDGGPWRDCPQETTFRGLSDGSHHLGVRALGIDGAPSDELSRTWTVARPASVATDPSSALATPQVTALDTHAPGITFIHNGQGLANLLRHGYLMRFRTDEPCEATLQLLVSGSAARRLHIARSAVVARGKATFTKQGLHAVRARFTKRARHRLRHARRLHATLRLTLVDAAGNKAKIVRPLARRR